ncbi:MULTISPECIES: CapA family protein [Butyricimonas]|uniref:CapA family protein n=1 Tax=Butyricimonas TaxID=574697 RepID=UPI0007FB3C09|nr:MULTISPECIES: CapA family protein [Butyricimonas]
MKVLVSGDFCPKYRVENAVKEKRFGDLFDDVRPIIDSVNYSIVNFEFPIVLNQKDANPIPKCGPNLQGTIEAVEAVKYAGFDCCTLANNHILDQGEKCCLDTKQELERAGIDTVGVGCNLDKASNILYKKINEETLAIINCCEHEFSIAAETAAGANPLNPIQQFYKIKEAKSKADYVLVIVHGGHEHYQLPSPRMQETYRFFIDAGADAIINHHQHCYSGYEVYNTKPIFYGLGNFCFDSLNEDHSIWNEGYLVEVEFKKDNISYMIHPYIQCNESVGVSLMKERQFDNFQKSITKLNNVIANSKNLKQEWLFWMQNNDGVFRNVIEPYSNRITCKLFRLGLLPSFAKKKKYRLINYLQCESHLDRLLNHIINL